MVYCLGLVVTLKKLGADNQSIHAHSQFGQFQQTSAGRLLREKMKVRRVIEALTLFIVVAIWAAFAYTIAEGTEVTYGETPYVVEARTLAVFQETPFQMESAKNSSAAVLQPDGITVVFVGRYQVEAGLSQGEWVIQDGSVTVTSPNSDFTMRVKQHRYMILIEIILSFVLLLIVYLAAMWKIGSTW